MWQVQPKGGTDRIWDLVWSGQEQSWESVSSGDVSEVKDAFRTLPLISAPLGEPVMFFLWRAASSLLVNIWWIKAHKFERPQFRLWDRNRSLTVSVLVSKSLREGLANADPKVLIPEPISCGQGCGSYCTVAGCWPNKTGAGGYVGDDNKGPGTEGAGWSGFTLKCRTGST